MQEATSITCDYLHEAYMYIRSDIKNCEGWLSPGGHSSGQVKSEAPSVQPSSFHGWSRECHIYNVLLEYFSNRFSSTDEPEMVIQTYNVFLINLFLSSVDDP